MGKKHASQYANFGSLQQRQALQAMTLEICLNSISTVTFIRSAHPASLHANASAMLR